MAYGAFLRLMKVLFDLWKEEIGDDSLFCPPRYFYDKTFTYTHCDRVGGLEVSFQIYLFKRSSFYTTM